jgi:hypothetical protein
MELRRHERSHTLKPSELRVFLSGIPLSWIRRSWQSMSSIDIAQRGGVCMNDYRKEDLATEKTEHPYDSLLSKYIAVWLWSAIFGAVSGVFFSFISFRSYEGKWRAFSILATLLTGIGLLAILSSSVALYRGLAHYLLPKFLLNKDPDPLRLALSLKSAVLMLIVASLARILMSLAELIVSSLSTF